MKKLLLILILLFAPNIAVAQCTGVFGANTVCGTLTSGTPHAVPFTSFPFPYTAITGVPAHTFLGNNTGATANAIAMTDTQATAELNPCSATLKGLVPTPPNNTSTFLRGDCTFAAPTSSSGGNPGYVSVYYNGSQWVYQKQDGTVITAASSTCQIQEAITYAYGAGYGVIVYGQGSANPCAMTEQTISVPAGRGNNFLCLNCYWTFANTNHNGISFDNQQQCSWKMPGGSIFYSGDSSHIAILFSPQTTVLGTKWSAWCDYDFGSVTANGGTPAALVYIDLPINNASQVLASNFVNNRLHFNTLYGGNIAQYNFRYNTPAGANNAGGENWIHFTDNQDAALAEVSIGTIGGSALDVNLGTNHYSGNIGHTTTNVSSAGIITDSSLDTFELTALNCYNSGSGQNNVQWGASATNNVIQTKQAIACTGGLEGGTAQIFTMNNYFTGTWRAFTPVLTCAGGTVSSSTATGRALLLQPLSLSKSVNWSMDLALTTLSGCTTSSGGAISASVPFTAQTGASGIGREIASSGNALIAQIGAGGTSYSINLSGNTCPDCVSGRHMIVSGSVELQ